MGDQAPRSRRSGTSEHARDRAGRRGLRRCRIILYIAGGLLGPGYWLCGAVWDGKPFGKSPAEVHFTEFVLASVVVVVASWGLLLILGEAMLFALAVFKADDRERYDIYRNLMILWGYVLTLGIPRHFRRLPAQFGGLPDTESRLRGEDVTCHHEDVRDRPRPRRENPRGSGAFHDREEAGSVRRGAASQGAANGGTARGRGGERRGGERARTGEREEVRRDVAPRDREPSDDRETPRRRQDVRGRGTPRPETRGDAGSVEEKPGTDRRERTRTGERRSPRDRAAPPENERDDLERRPSTDARRTRRRTAPHDDEGARDETGRRRPPRRGEAAALDEAVPGPAPRESPRPLGPIFPPRPAAEVEVTPIPGSPNVPGRAPFDASSLADTVPEAQTELRNALDLLLRYAASIEGDETASPPPAPEPKLCDGKPFGVIAETSGDP